MSLEVNHNKTVQTEPYLNHDNATTARSKIVDVAHGLFNSRILRAAFLAGMSVTILFALISNPAGWMITAAAVGAFALGLLSQIAVDRGMQKLTFELTAFARLFNRHDYNMVYKARNGAKLFLGSLPNRLINFDSRLKQENVQAVLSVNEPWERKPFGFSLPYQSQDWSHFNVDYLGLDVKDHTYLTTAQLDQAAEFIKSHLDQGKNVYVHCRAGCGRSAMAIAAYLIKHQQMSATEAAKQIHGHRSKSSINKKLKDKGNTPGLESYAAAQHS